MDWRKQATHRGETKAVKEALIHMGIRPLRVGHGRGTAWGWLEINLGPETSYETQRRAVHIALEVTGRRGEYDGKILVLAQAEFSGKVGGEQ